MTALASLLVTTSSQAIAPLFSPAPATVAGVVVPSAGFLDLAPATVLGMPDAARHALATPGTILPGAVNPTLAGGQAPAADAVLEWLMPQPVARPVQTDAAARMRAPPATTPDESADARAGAGAGDDVIADVQDNGPQEGAVDAPSQLLPALPPPASTSLPAAVTVTRSNIKAGSTILDLPPVATMSAPTLHVGAAEVQDDGTRLVAMRGLLDESVAPQTSDGLPAADLVPVPSARTRRSGIHAPRLQDGMPVDRRKTAPEALPVRHAGDGISPVAPQTAGVTTSAAPPAAPMRLVPAGAKDETSAYGETITAPAPVTVDQQGAPPPLAATVVTPPHGVDTPAMPLGVEMAPQTGRTLPPRFRSASVTPVPVEAMPALGAPATSPAEPPATAVPGLPADVTPAPTRQPAYLPVTPAPVGASPALHAPTTPPAEPSATTVPGLTVGVAPAPSRQPSPVPADRPIVVLGTGVAPQTSDTFPARFRSAPVARVAPAAAPFMPTPRGSTAEPAAAALPALAAALRPVAIPFNFFMSAPQPVRATAPASGPATVRTGNVASSAPRLSDPLIAPPLVLATPVPTLATLSVPIATPASGAPSPSPTNGAAAASVAPAPTPQVSVPNAAAPTTLVAAKPAPTATTPIPPLPQPITPAYEPAARAFAEAIHRAVSMSDAGRPMSGEGMVPVAPAVLLPMAATAMTAPPIDMTRDMWPQAMVSRIEMLRDMVDAADTRIRLVPDALGAIDVTLRRDGDTVHVQLAAEQPQTRALLAEAQPRLAELAEARGVKLQQTGGGTHADAQTGGQAQRQPHQQSPQPAAPARPRTATTDADTEERIA